MRAVVQRVKSASVLINESEKRLIDGGLVVLCGFTDDDTDDKIAFVADKIVNLRIFGDQEGKLNLSVNDVKGELLVVSNFTLYGDCSHGRRPNFTKSAKPELSKGMYDSFVSKLKASGLKVETGEFGADMLLDISNDGPVTLIVEK